jgi:protease-4
MLTALKERCCILMRNIRHWFHKSVVVLGYIILLICSMAIAFQIWKQYQNKLPSSFILHIDLDGRYPDGISTYKDGPYTSFSKFMLTLERALQDSHIKGILVRVFNPEMSLSQQFELSTLLQVFELQKKPVWIFYGGVSDTLKMGPFIIGNGASKIIYQKNSTQLFKGFGIERTYYRSLLDFIGVYPEFIKRENYKSAPESYTHKGFSDAARANYTALLQALRHEVISFISKTTMPDSEEKNELQKNLKTVWESAFQQVFFSDVDLKQKGFIQDIGTWNSVIKNMVYELFNFSNEKENKNFIKNHVVSFKKYRSHINKNLIKEKRIKKPGIALIHIEGPVELGELEWGYDPFEGATASRLLLAIRAAREKDHIRGVVLRVNSGGGSGAATNLVFPELELLAKEKPVYVSVGGCSASAAYYMSVPAHKIMVTPFSIIGSIGAYAGKFSLDTWVQDRFVKGDHIDVDPHATNWNSMFQRWDHKHTVKILNDDINFDYEKFLEDVYRNRKKSFRDIEHVREKAQGKVFMPKQAPELFDDVGTLSLCLLQIKRAAELEITSPVYNDADVDISAMDILKSIFGGNISFKPLEYALSRFINQTMKTVIRTLFFEAKKKISNTSLKQEEQVILPF